GWMAESAEQPEILRRFQRAGGARLVVTRTDHPNRAARRGDRDFFAEVERGLARSVPDYRRHKSKTFKLGSVPALDLWFHRNRGRQRQLIAMRFLFFRRFTLALAVSSAPSRRPVLGRAERAALSSFKPFAL